MKTFTLIIAAAVVVGIPTSGLAYDASGIGQVLKITQMEVARQNGLIDRGFCVIRGKLDRGIIRDRRTWRDFTRQNVRRAQII